MKPTKNKNAGKINKHFGENEGVGNAKAKEWVSLYTKAGFSVIPIKHGGKTPLVKEWNEKTNKTFDIPEGANVGLVLSGGLAGLDIDTDDPLIWNILYNKAPQLLGEKTWVSITPSGGYHIYYRIPPEIKDEPIFAKDKDGKRIVEFYTHDRFFVEEPSSTNKSRWQWIRPIEEAEIARHDQKQYEVLRDYLLFCQKYLSLIQTIVPSWVEGVRHDGGRVLAGALRKAEISKKDARAITKRICEITGDSEVADRLRAVDDTFSRKKPLKEIKGISGIKEAFGEDAERDLSRILGFREKGKEKKEEVLFLPYFEDEGRLYLDVQTSDGYKFAYLNDGKVKFIDDLQPDKPDKPDLLTRRPKKNIKPKELPIGRDGPCPIVKLPTEEIKDLAIPTAEALFKEITAHLRQYIDAPEKDIELFGYYALFTWFYRKVSVVPYFRLLADTGKGKSRIKKVVGDLCFYPTYAGGSSSYSGMFRYNEQWHGTLIIDEADIRGGEENKFVKYLNLGFESGQPFILTNKQDPTRQEFFDPFSPKIIAMRKPFNDNATEGRCLSVSPHERTNKGIPIMLPPEYEETAERLRNKIALFTMVNWPKVDGSKMISYDNLGIEPRLQQLAMPLSIVFQVWEEGKERFREYLKYRQEEIKKIRSQSWEGAIFNLAYELATELDDETGKKPKYVGSRMIAKKMGTTSKAVGDALRSIGFERESKYIIIDEKQRHRQSWVVNSRQAWEEIISRYYYNPEDDGSIDVPDALRGSKFIKHTPDHPFQI
ncbi:MAG: hypothetical protein MASP_00968 [Candidatus Methanolliviera sp. GoM_asphalt]|nr:MAG: hypothetical protein MASP_00968 [Candidatus Methanolliviera sp. GoM_asphalt]